MITQPGLVLRLPFGIHDVYILDVTPQTFHLRGADEQERRSRSASSTSARRTVRASSSTTRRSCSARSPCKADETLRDSGLGHAYYEWMLPYARAILRDEFGRESTISVSNPTSFAPGRGPREEAAQQAARPARHRGHEHRHAAPAVLEGVRGSDRVAQPDREPARRDRLRAVAREDRARSQARRGRARSEQDHPDQARRARERSSRRRSPRRPRRTARSTPTRSRRSPSGEAARSAAKGKADELKGQLEADYAAKQGRRSTRSATSRSSA